MSGRARLADGVDVVDRRRRDAWPQGNPGAGRGLRGHSAPEGRLQGPRARRDGYRRHPRPPARRWCSSTNSPTPTRPAAATPSAISTSRKSSTHGIDVYTTLNIQHVESLNDVVAQITRVRVRETVPDSIIDQRRRYRDHRPHARRPDQAAEGRQGLFPEHRPARDRELFLAGQSDGAAGTGAAPHRPARRRAVAQPHAGARDSWPLGGGRTGARLRRRASGRSVAVSAMHAGWPTGCARRGRRCMSRRRARPAMSEDGQGPAGRRCCAWPSSSAPR